MELKEIYEKQAKAVKDAGYTVTVDEKLGTVTIEKVKGPAISYFLQGDEGVQFIEGAREVWRKAEDLPLDDAFTGHAYDYIS